MKKEVINHYYEVDDLEFEEWEIEAEYFDKEDWDGLVKYRYKEIQKYPKDIDIKWGLGEAYVLNKEYEKAIELLIPLHKLQPENPNIQHTLLDALFAIGKDENSIPWICKPKIIRLGEEVSILCYNYLKKRRTPKTVSNIYLELIVEGYLVFNEDELMDFLRTDNRFILNEINDPFYECKVVARKIRE